MDQLGAAIGIGLLALTLGVAGPFALHYFDARTAGANPPGLAAYLRIIAKEWWYVLAYAFLGLGGRIPTGPRGFDPAGGPPVILTHGYFLNRACLFAVYWRLRRRGYRNVYVMPLGPWLARMETLVDSMARNVRDISRLSGDQGVTVVAHSMGGLVMRKCIAENPDLPLAKLVCIATPHQGTRMAYFAPTYNGRLMVPGSPFLRSLPSESDIPVASLYTLVDNIVIPSDYGRFGESSTEYSRCGHISLLFEPEAFGWIVAQLPALGEDRIAA